MARSGGGGLIHNARGEAKPFLFVLAAVAALGGFLFGYDTGTFLLCAAVGLLALIFFATRVPETNGRTLEEAEQQLQRKRRGKTWAPDDAPAVG